MKDSDSIRLFDLMCGPGCRTLPSPRLLIVGGPPIDRVMLERISNLDGFQVILPPAFENYKAMITQENIESLYTKLEACDLDDYPKICIDSITDQKES